MAKEYEEVVEFTEDVEVSHREYLAEFKEKVWPVFEPYGFTFPEAYNYWALNKLHNAVDKLCSVLDDRLT
jgi:hypothetical protein